MEGRLEIRRLQREDPPVISSAFSQIGWCKPVVQFEHYLVEQSSGLRDCLVATMDARFAGYVTVSWAPEYQAPAESGIPEIQDLNVLPQFRRQGIATRLLDKAEGLVSMRSSIVGIGVGLHPGYNAAQRLYGKRGYVPDGLGITWRGCYVPEGAHVILDDDLVLHLTKTLR